MTDFGYWRARMLDVTQRDLDRDLLDRMIEAARNHRMTPAEIRAQRISFIHGQMNGAVSKEYIAQRLESWGGLG